MQHVLDAIYDAAVDPARWPVALESVALLFDAHFADLFTRTQDRAHFSGLAFGLDQADYEDEFLGRWFKRNVWGNAKPTTTAGEVLSTRSMVDVAVLKRSEIYADYLHPRGLHEGLRLALYADPEQVRDISLLRPWSHGPFEAAEITLGEMLLPHLQRATALTTRLQALHVAATSGLPSFEDAAIAAVTYDAAGEPVTVNAAAERLLGRPPTFSRGVDSLGRALARATGRAGGLRASGQVLMTDRDGRTLHAMVVPLTPSASWAMARPPAAVVLFRTATPARVSEARLAELFGLTRAEAELANMMLMEDDLRKIAAASQRSLHTVRNHLARVMDKTGTNRRSELLRLLTDLADFAGADRSPSGSGQTGRVRPTRGFLGGVARGRT